MYRCTKRFFLLVVAATSVLFNFQPAAASTLAGRFAELPPGSSIDLTSAGELNWAHWGLFSATSFDYQAAFSRPLSDYTVVGTGVPQRVDSIAADYSWSDGAPDVFVANSTTAVMVTGVSNGFQLQVPLPGDAYAYRLKVYVGVYSAQARMEASFSDGSVPAYVNTSLDSTSGESNRVYSIDFTGGTVGQFLNIKLTLLASHDPTLGSVRLHSASYQKNFAPTITLNTPSAEAAMPSPAAIQLEATADDFEVGGSVQKVEFFTNNVLLVSLGNSLSSIYSFEWTNAPPGFYDITARVTGNDGETASAGPVTVCVYNNTGTLTASIAPTPSTVDLTAEGVADWAHWGLLRETSFNHKAGVTSQIGNYRCIAGGPAYQFNDNPSTYTWSDGTPTATASATPTGVYLTFGDGFELDIPADTNLKTLKLYLGAFAARGRLLLYLSDFSGALVDTSVLPQGDFGISTTNDVYSINFRAASSNQTLTVRYTVAEKFNTFGNVTLQAATLTTGNVPPHAVITNISEGAVFTAPASVSIQAAASDPDGSLARVEFYDGSTKLGEAASSPYQFDWNNTPPGRHTLTARAVDNNGATFTSPAVNCFVLTGGGMLSGSLAAASASADLSALGALDWAHWGLTSANSFNHKAGVPQQIGHISKVGTGTLQRFSAYPTAFSWANGTPTAATSGSPTAILLEGLGSGFQITVPADRARRRLNLFVGSYASLGHLEATLSDASAVSYVSQALSNIWLEVYGCYTLDYAAASAGQVLTVKFTSADLYDTLYGNVSWAAATLSALDLSLVNFQSTGTNFGFSFPTQFGTSYTVQYTDGLPSGWNTLTNVLGDGGLAGIVDTNAATAQRFYRVKVN